LVVSGVPKEGKEEGRACRGKGSGTVALSGVKKLSSSFTQWVFFKTGYIGQERGSPPGDLKQKKVSRTISICAREPKRGTNSTDAEGGGLHTLGHKGLDSKLIIWGHAEVEVPKKDRGVWAAGIVVPLR